MSQWTEQITEMQRSWVDRQRKLMDEWLESLRSPGASAPAGDWRQAAGFLETQVDGILDTQKQSLLVIADSMENAEGVPEAFKQGAHELRRSIELWADMQHQLWSGWFDMLRATTATPKSPGEAMLDDWRDMVRQTMSTQEQWLSSWADTAAEPAKASSAKSSGARRSRPTPGKGTKQRG